MIYLMLNNTLTIFKRKIKIKILAFYMKNHSKIKMNYNLKQIIIQIQIQMKIQKTKTEIKNLLKQLNFLNQKQIFMQFKINKDRQYFKFRKKIIEFK